MSLEARIESLEQTIVKLIDTLAANDDRPAFVKNSEQQQPPVNTGDVEAPKKRGPKAKAVEAAPAGTQDPSEHPAFKALVADVIRLVDLDNKNHTSRIAETCQAFGVQKASQLPPAQWAPFHEAVKAAIAAGSAPAPASASSFV